jgi:GAF domain-containing protein/signal transduction histidine kinase
MTIYQRDFSADEVTLLAGMADQAAMALENARLFEERERRISELTTLNDISQEISATLKQDELLTSLHRGISEVLNTADSFIALYDRETRRLSFPICWVDGAPIQDDEEIVIEDGAGLVNRVILERRPLLLRSQQEVDAISTGQPVPGERQISSWLGVPIIRGDQVLGILNVQSYEPNAFDEDDLRFLATVASQAATAIANAWLFDERERRLREVIAIKDIGSAVTSTLDLQDVLERLHSELGRVIDVSTSMIGLYDARTDVIWFPVFYDQGQRLSFTPTPLRFGTNGWAIRNRQTLLLNTIEQADQMGLDVRSGRIGPENQFEQSFLVVPIVSGNDVLGVINLQSYEQHAFSQDDLRFVSTVASQAAIAINNARLFQERGRQIEELATFNEIGQELSAATRYDDLIELLYRQTSRLLDTTNFYVALYDERRGEISFPLQYLRGQRITVDPVLLTNSPTAYVIRSREPLLLQGPQREAEIQARDLSPIGDRSLSWLGVPMIAADRVIGAIGIEDYERDTAYSQEDIRLLGTIASWGAIALENARLLGETRQSVLELTALHEISVALTGTLDTGEILGIVASSALELMRADVSAVFLFDAQLNISQQIILDNEDLGTTDRTIQIATNGMTRRLLSSDRPLVFNNIAAEVEESALGTQMRLQSALGAVIGSHDQPIGAIWLGSRGPHTWQEREISLLSILTNQCGQALESARLFQSEQTRRRVADTLREVAQTLTSVLKPDEITALILDQLARVVPYDTASLMLREHNVVRIAATRGFEEAVRAQIEQFSIKLEDDANMALIIQTRRPLVLDDAQDTPYWIPLEGTEHCHGWIGAPLLLDDEVIGLLTVDSSTIGAYDEEDAQLAFALASQAAQALRNARLVEQQQQYAAELERRVAERTAALADANIQLSAEKERLQAVHEITVELTENLDLEETLTKALGLASLSVGVKRGSIMLRDPRTGTLICRAVLTADGTVESTNIPISFSQGSGLAGWVLSQEKGIYIGDVRDDGRWLREEGRADEVRSVIAVPLITKDEPLGVLILSSPKLDYFGEAQLQLLSTIANEIAIVIHNAELYSYINDLASQLAEAYEQQREETSKSQAILQSVTEGVIVLDEQQHVVLFNPAAEQVLGIPASFALKQPLGHLKEYHEPGSSTRRAELIHTGLYDGLRALDERGKSHVGMLEIPNPTQSIAMNFAAVIRPDGVRYGSVAVLRDVTREIEADRAKRDFISSVSHELRTPLTSIKGYVDLLLLGAAGPIGEGQLSFLGVVKNNANRLMDLINDILEIGRIDADKIKLSFEQVSIENVFQDVLQTLRAEIDRKSLNVQIDIKEELPQITADLRRMTQVVLNVVSNAVKYTYPQGRVTLRAFVNPAGLLQAEVEDNGVGISPEQQQHLFRRFYRADNPLRDEVGGTGLGLSIAKSFVELHGGEMWVQSESGVGSTFSFILPVTQPEQLEQPEQPQSM